MGGLRTVWSYRIVGPTKTVGADRYCASQQMAIRRDGWRILHKTSNSLKDRADVRCRHPWERTRCTIRVVRQEAASRLLLCGSWRCKTGKPQWPAWTYACLDCTAVQVARQEGWAGRLGIQAVGQEAWIGYGAGGSSDIWFGWGW